jgi:hypothetical protein
VRVCAGGEPGTKNLRVPSFDGVPLDADLTLPARGSGPFPLVVLLHGLGEDKQEYERFGPIFTASELARRGYAALTYTARGFGDSCGTPAARRVSPGCRRGWTHLADQRFEVRDAQRLAGMLVDQGIARPAVAFVGISYGAGEALELAMLDDRVRLEDGRLVPWRSPLRHVPMRVAAVVAQWGWSDLADALAPNGSLRAGSPPDLHSLIDPVGVAKAPWIASLYGIIRSAGYEAPPGADPTADLASWERRALAGEPYGARFEAVLRQLERFKSALGVPVDRAGPAPIFLQEGIGLSDTLFPASQGLALFAALSHAGARAPRELVLADWGHDEIVGSPRAIATTTEEASTFLDDLMLRGIRPPSFVQVLVHDCTPSGPSSLPASKGGTIVEGADWRSVERGTVKASLPGPFTVSSAAAAPVDPSLWARCAHLPPSAPIPGEVVLRTPVSAGGLLLVGAPEVQATATLQGSYPELVAELYDVTPDHTRQIVAIGVDRPDLRPGVASRVHFELFPTAYRFPAGDSVELVLAGSDPTTFRPSNGRFTLTLENVTLTLP